MAKKRFTDIEIWDREWYMELSPKHKCLMKYIFDKCDASGCWKPNWKLASLHIGEKVEFSDLSQLPQHQYEILDSGKVFIPDFIKFQYGQLSKKSPAHNPIFAAIEKNNLSNRVFNRVSHTPKEEDKEKEEEGEKEEEKGGRHEKLLIPEMLSVWKKHKKDYPEDKTKDWSALQSIAKFICDHASIKYNPQDTNSNKGIYSLWDKISEFISTHNFFKNYSLHQVEKHIQSITQEIKNGTTKNGQSGAGKVTGQQLNKAFADFHS